MSESVEQLYVRYGPALLRRARAILGSEAAARDAVQETFVTALRSEAQFRREASPMTWLYRITTNHCLNVLRDSSRRQELLAERVADAETEPAQQPSHDDRLTLAQVLRRVSPELQEIAVFYYVDRMGQEEIARLLSVARRTVGNRLEEFRRQAAAAAGEEVRS